MAEITGGELLLRCLHAEGVRHAFRMAMSGRPGPTHILIPEDIIWMRCRS